MNPEFFSLSVLTAVSPTDFVFCFMMKDIIIWLSSNMHENCKPIDLIVNKKNSNSPCNLTKEGWNIWKLIYYNLQCAIWATFSAKIILMIYLYSLFSPIQCRYLLPVKRLYTVKEIVWVILSCLAYDFNYLNTQALIQFYPNTEIYLNLCLDPS
jgi:hypothetical protein